MDETETLRIGLEVVRQKLDESLAREVELTQMLAKLRREKDESRHKAQLMEARHRALVDRLRRLTQTEAAHV